MNVINRDACVRLRGELEAALRDFAAATGLAVTVGAATYSPLNVTFKVNLSVAAEGGEPMTPEAEAFRANASLYGLKPEHLFRTFRLNGTAYKLVGCKPRSGRFPLLGQRTIDGKVYKLPAGAVQLAIAQAGLVPAPPAA